MIDLIYSLYFKMKTIADGQSPFGIPTVVLEFVDANGVVSSEKKNLIAKRNSINFYQIDIILCTQVVFFLFVSEKYFHFRTLINEIIIGFLFFERGFMEVNLQLKRRFNNVHQ